MRLYSIYVKPNDGFTPTTLHWAATQREAKLLTKLKKEEFPDGSASWNQREVPTDKTGLLRWLNHHANKP